MIVLTEQELISIFDAGRKQGDDEATSREWGSRPNETRGEALMGALAQILYDRRAAENKEAWPFGAQWPEESEVVEAFGLKCF